MAKDALPLKRVSTVVPSERVEEARAAMLDLFPEGFEERDVPDGVELAAYTDLGRDSLVRQTFGAVRADEVEPNWEERWREFHRGVRVGPLWVGPPWEEVPAGALAVVIEPGRAFGTGAHPTTRLCLELLAELPRGALLDVGCGSGVLAVAAAKLGFAPVHAVDFDPLAVEATAGNASANGVEILVSEIDALTGELPKLGTTVANLTLDAVRSLAARIQSAHLVASGYLAADRPVLSGFASVLRRELDGWAADVWVQVEESEPLTR
jgi:ribosomal protein L11 methyltransferase